MKREKKEYLKSLGVTGFKWDMTPLEMYTVCDIGQTYYEADKEECIKISKRDLKKLLDTVMLRHRFSQRAIRSMQHDLGA